MGFQVGDRVGDYEIVQVLGAGGMGQVYKVRNVISERIEAMKVLLPNLESDPELADRFVREIKVQASLEHPNIAALHTAQRVDNQLVMIMEFVEGTTLESLLEQGPLPLGNAVADISQVLAALSYAHARGIVHRDIKPANMMLTPNGTVKLMDFGIAKVTAERKLTQTGKTVGSLFYMSPEQIRGAGVDARSDLYSVGIALYELVTGRRPFQGDSDYSIMAAHLQQQPIPPIQVDPSLPATLNEIILMSIAKDPEQRFQSADAFRAALGNVAASFGVAVPGVATAPLPQPAGPPPAPVGPLAMPPFMPPAPVPSPGGHRGLYMVLGSLATVAVLAVGIWQAPKFLGTKASSVSSTQSSAGGASQPSVGGTVTPSQPSGGPAAASPGTASAQPADQSPSLPPGQSAETPSQPPRQQALPAETPSRPSAQRAERKPTVSVRPPARETSPAETRVQEQPAAREQPPANVQSQPSQPPSRPAADSARTAELNQLRERYNLLAVRVGAAKTGLQSIKSQMARTGVGLRADIREAESRMDYLMQESMSSLRAGDADGARRSMQMAERALETIEKFLGQ